MPWTPPQIGAIEPPGDVTVIEYEVIEADFVQACFDGAFSVKGTYSGVVTLVLLMGVAGLVVSSELGWMIAAYVVAGSALAIVIIAWIVHWAFSKQIKRNFARVEADASITLAYGDRFIGTRTGRSIAGMSYLYAVKKTTGMRLVYTAPNVYFFVPVRAFASNAELDRFDRIVSSLCTEK